MKLITLKKKKKKTTLDISFKNICLKIIIRKLVKLILVRRLYFYRKY